MRNRYLRKSVLVLLALVFTVGLTFATVELPYRLDSLLHDNIRVPGFDSQADEVARLKAGLFIDHYNLREIGYAAFFLTLLLIAAGFAWRRSGLAAFGALAFMLPVFAQFAGVMFFLAGLGILNVLWLPLLDISFRVQQLGEVIHAPYDLLMWLGRLAGVNAYWYIVYFFIAAGLLVFFVGTYSWLSTRAGRGRKVADLWIYRFSRHPQYAGWIMWSYGMYLLLLLQRYPKRSWGISGSLPWLISTMVIIGVAMVEEIRMLGQAGAEYRRYRENTPMLFPMPRALRRFFSLPLRWIFGKRLPERTREVVVVLAVYTAILLSSSYLFYMGGMGRIASALSGEEARSGSISEIAGRIVSEENWRVKYRLGGELAGFGEAATGQLVELLESDQETVRVVALEALADIAPAEAAGAVAGALSDQSENVRWKAAGTLARIFALRGVDGLPGDPSRFEPLLETLLADEKSYVRIEAMRALVYLRSDLVTRYAEGFLTSGDHWFRSGTMDVLGLYASMSGGDERERAVRLISSGLEDEEPGVRRAAVLALLRSGSASACPALEAARDDGDWEVRIYASEVAGRLCGR